MISSFWNICRACPSMPLGEKFHSEYRSTFQWHEKNSGCIEAAGSNPSTSTTIVHKQPVPHNRNLQSSLTDKSGEPPIPRRKKYPDLAYRTNEWITKTDDPTSKGQLKLQPANIKDHTLRPKKSISMGTIPGHVVPVKLYPTIPEKASGLDSSILAESKDDVEFKKNPALHTQEIGHHENEEEKNLKESDQADLKKKEYKSEYKERFRPFSQYEYVDGKFMNRRGEQDADRPWYAEVIELRKKAGEYKFRGWGTDLCSPNALLNQQLWEQVSRRSSLAPLALITTTPRYEITKADKDKENARKSYMGKGSIGRPHTATPKHPIYDMDKYKNQKDGETVLPMKKKLLDETINKNFPKMKARSQSAGPSGRSPRKSTRQPSTNTSKCEKETIGAGWKVQEDAICADSRSKPQRHLRPNSADPSFGYKDTVHPIKSPPEPTRMKSPEQALVRSPDAVNWTVPLDTTKGFTVTQNIKEAPPSPRKLPGVGNETKPLNPGILLSNPTKPAINGFERKFRDVRGVKTASPKKPPTEIKKGGKEESNKPNLTETIPATKVDKQTIPATKVDKQPTIIGTKTQFGKPGPPVRCLEDPTFMFDVTKSKPPPVIEFTQSTVKPQPKGVRVLEAPVELSSNKPTMTDEGVVFVPPPVASSVSIVDSKVSGTPPKSKKRGVLEAPNEASGTVKSGSSGRSKASDVLEKARHKFDKFWGKSKDDEK